MTKWTPISRYVAFSSRDAFGFTWLSTDNTGVPGYGSVFSQSASCQVSAESPALHLAVYQLNLHLLMHLSPFRLQALEKEVADLAASLDDTSAAAVALKGDISRLSVPAEQPPPVQLSEDEDELQESSEVSLTFGNVLLQASHACFCSHAGALPLACPMA